MKKLLLLLLFPISLNAQTYFGSVAVPTDNGTSATSPVAFANPPIASMVSGDLVIVYAYCRTGSATISVSNAGGQTWTSETAHSSSTATLTGRIFWCTYNGTWSAAPSFSFSATTNTNVVMHVFRPSSGSNSWALSTATTTGTENTLVSNVSAATWTVPFDIGSTYTPDNNKTVNLAIFNTDDDNTWGSPSGTGWTQVTSPASQFRNTSGSDVSSAYMYIIKATAGTVPFCQLTEATLGNDGGIQGLYIWYEVPPAPPASHRVVIISK